MWLMKICKHQYLGKPDFLALMYAVLQDDGLHPIHYTTVQSLKLEDCHQRVWLGQWVLSHCSRPVLSCQSLEQHFKARHCQHTQWPLLCIPDSTHYVEEWAVRGSD
jgi:hypothetical protein